MYYVPTAIAGVLSSASVTYVCEMFFCRSCGHCSGTGMEWDGIWNHDGTQVFARGSTFSALSRNIVLYQGMQVIQ